VSSDLTVVCQPSNDRFAEFLEAWVDEDVVPYYYDAVQRERALAAEAATQQAQGPASRTAGADNNAAAATETGAIDTENMDAQKQPPLVLALKAIFRRLTRSLVHGMSSSGAGYGWSVGVYDELYVPSMAVTDQTPEELARHEAAVRERQQRREEERQQRQREREVRRKRNSLRELTEEEIRRREVAVFVPWI
jgi:hypothetical protein